MIVVINKYLIFNILMLSILIFPCCSKYQRHPIVNNLNIEYNKGCVKGCMVFVGDSNVHATNWQSYFTENVCNYGIAGSTTWDVYLRRERVKKLRPARIVMLVGGNDLLRYVAIDKITNNYRKIITYYKTFCKDIYCISNLPVKNDIYLKNWALILLNMQLEKVCTELGATFVNVHPYLYDGLELTPRYSVDPLHINNEARNVIVSVLKEHLK